MEKKCFKCQEVKSLDEFYRHGQMADGYLNKCKSCAKYDASKHRSDNLEEIRAYDRERHNNNLHRERNRCNYRIRMSDPDKKQRVIAQSRQWREKNKLKRAAHILVGNAIKRGIIIQKPCERCGCDKDIHAHHEDYTKPLEIVWLCKSCHGQRHREINEERRNE